MAIIYSYPIATPKLGDLILGTSIGGKNQTKSYTVQSLAELLGAVTQIVAGTDISISPLDGKGIVTINSTVDPGVTSIIAGSNVVLGPASGVGDVTISVPNVVKSVTSGNVNLISIGGTPENPTVTATVAPSIIDGGLSLATTNTIYDFVIGQGYIPYSENSTASISFVNDSTSLGGGTPSNFVVPTQLAVKTYVDNVVTGQLVYQGGYNAATNTPDLTTSPNSILRGWTYTVTAAGTFFGETVEIGDLLIAEIDNPTSLGNWTTVQNNIGLATESIPGIANFPVAGGLSITSGAVSLPDTGAIAGSYSIPDITVDAKGRVTAIANATTGFVSDFNSAAGTFVTVTNNVSAEGSVDIGTVDLSATGTPSTSNFLRGDNTWSTALTSVGITSPLSTIAISNSPLTANGNIGVDLSTSGVTPGSYTNSNITIDAYGRITVASNGTPGGVTDFTNSNGTFISYTTENTAATGSITTGSVDLSATGTPSATTFLRGDNSWTDQLDILAGASTIVEIEVKNLEGAPLVKGDPVYLKGTVGASTKMEVGLADASNAAKMPSIGILAQDLAINGEGFAVVTGTLKNLVTTPIDGATATTGDTIYVKPGGGLTLTKPTGPTNFIQNVGQIGRVSIVSDGSILASCIMRANDVPNLPTGKIWVGDSNTTVSNVVYLDETNLRMGLNTITPSQDLHVSGNTRITGAIYDSNNTPGTSGQVLSSTVTGTDWVSLSEISGVDGSGTTNYVAKWSDTDTITDSVIYDNGTNVGIGTAGPSEKLEVSGNILASGSIQGNSIIKTGGVATEFLKADGSVDTTIYLDGFTTGNSTFINLSDVGTINNPDITAILSATGTPSTTTFLRGDNIWNTAVTSITAGTGLNGGTITTTGTINLTDTAVSPGAYTNANITVDQQGRITLASNGVSGGVTSFTASSGTFISLSPITLQTGAVTLTSDLSASGTADNTTFLRGDNAWDIAVTGLAVGNSSFINLSNVGTANVPDITATLSATGTPDATTFLRGDNAWVTVAGTTYDYASAQSGSNVNLNLIPSTGTTDTVTLVAGSGITLTDNGSNNVTIASSGGGGGYSREINNFTISDSTTSSLTLTLSQPDKNYVDLFIDGVYQSKLLYSTTNNILTLNSGFFPDGSAVEAIIINGVAPPPSSITADSTTITADSTTITADQT